MSFVITVDLRLTYNDTGAAPQTNASIEVVAVERHNVSLAAGASEGLDLRHPGGEKLCTLVIESTSYDGTVTYKIDAGAETPLTQPLVLLGQNPSGLVNPQPQVITLKNTGANEVNASLVAGFAAP
jgi:hypothetical protein